MSNPFVEDDPNEPVELAWKSYQGGICYPNILRMAGKGKIPLEGSLWSAFYAGFYAGRIQALTFRVGRAIEEIES